MGVGINGTDGPVGLGYTCPGNYACTSGECSGNTCVCPSGYYDTNGGILEGTCALKIGLGSTCIQQDVCADSNSLCSGNICVCRSRYYDSNGGSSGGTCELKVGLGSACIQQDACADSNTLCSGSICVCRSGYYDSNGGSSGGTCELKVDLGSQCPQSDACKTTNSHCGISPSNVASTCVCNASYYDTNGVQPNGECRDVISLQVTSVSYGNITEDTIPISWNAPSDQVSVNYYLVEHGPVDNSVAAYSQTVSTNTSAVLSRLEQGKKYSITITSFNTQTALSARSAPVTRYQISKPSSPGALLKTKDLDASSGNATLQWTRSVGVVTGYGGFLRNNTQFLYNQAFNTSGTLTEQIFFGVKSGTWYTFTLQAVSGYSDTSMLYSDLHTEIIKTRVEVPGPPSNITCSDSLDGSLLLSWKATENPNGVILYYIITVQKTYPNPETAYNISTSSADTTLTLNNLSEGSFYGFKIYTVNEIYQSAKAAKILSCQTSALMAGKPKDLAVSDLTSRFGTVRWNNPSNVSGVFYGYSLQIHNNDSCIREVLLKCSDCLGTFPSLISGGCTETFEQFVNSSKLLGLQTYEAYNLLPDSDYIVAVSAITGIGRGQVALAYLQTNEEAPQKPYDVKVEMITSTSANVVWKIDGPRPGDTNYAIVGKGYDPAGHKSYRMNGFYARSFNMTSLEEFWNYSVTVQAETNIGHNSSDPVLFQTSIGPPGEVMDVYVGIGSGAYMYRTTRIVWKMPGILERNGPINSFYVRQEEKYEGTFMQMNFTEVLAKSDESFSYTAEFPVVPEKTYKFTIKAINGHPFPGSESIVEYLAPAGPPINIEEQGIDVIVPGNLSAHTQTSFPIEINVDFFMDQTNGHIRTRGLICCKDPICKDGNSSAMMLGEIDNLATYTKAKLSNSYMYRLSLLEVNVAATKNDSRMILYSVGTELCDNRTANEYCNGPLEPDSNYRIIAFACTSGWCTLSRSYGPFATLSDNLSATTNVNPVSMQTIIIACTVCGTLILLALIITIVKVNRARVAKRQSNPKTSDIYMSIAVTTPENIYGEIGSPVYENTRMDN